MTTTQTTTKETTMATLRVTILSGRPGTGPLDFMALESGTERTEHGALTTEHAESSYGLPVVVLDGGRVIGPADLDNMRLLPLATISEDADGNEYRDYPGDAQALVAAARRAGYSIRDCD